MVVQITCLLPYKVRCHNLRPASLFVPGCYVLDEPQFMYLSRYIYNLESCSNTHCFRPAVLFIPGCFIVLGSCFGVMVPWYAGCRSCVSNLDRQSLLLCLSTLVHWTLLLWLYSSWSTREVSGCCVTVFPASLDVSLVSLSTVVYRGVQNPCYKNCFSHHINKHQLNKYHVLKWCWKYWTRCSTY